MQSVSLTFCRNFPVNTFLATHVLPEHSALASMYCRLEIVFRTSCVSHDKSELFHKRNKKSKFADDRRGTYSCRNKTFPRRNMAISFALDGTVLQLFCTLSNDLRLQKLKWPQKKWKNFKFRTPFSQWMLMLDCVPQRRIRPTEVMRISGFIFISTAKSYQEYHRYGWVNNWRLFSSLQSALSVGYPSDFALFNPKFFQSCLICIPLLNEGNLDRSLS